MRKTYFNKHFTIDTKKNLTKLINKLKERKEEFGIKGPFSDIESGRKNEWCPIIIYRGPTTLISQALLMIDRTIQHERDMAGEDTLYNLLKQTNFEKNTRGIVISQLALYFKLDEQDAMGIFNPDLRTVRGIITKARAISCLKWRIKHDWLFWNLFDEEGKRAKTKKTGPEPYEYWDKTKRHGINLDPNLTWH